VRGIVAPGDAANMTVYVNPAALPRAYVETGVRTAATEDNAIRHLLDPQFDPQSEVVAERAGTDRPAGTQLAPAEIVTYATDRVVITADTKGDGTLVLTDSYAGGWEATRSGLCSIPE